MLTPHFFCDFHDHPQLSPLLVLGEHVAFLSRSKSALRRQAELIERGVFSRLLDTFLDLVWLSSPPLLLVTRPSTADLPLGNSRNGSKPPARSLSYSMK